MQKRKPILYILVSYGITWACWIPAIIIAERNGFQLPNPTSVDPLFGTGVDSPLQTFASWLFNFAVYGPLIAALLVTYLELGKQGILDLFGRVAKWRVHLKWYGVIISIAVVIALLPKLIGMLFGLTTGGLLVVGSLPAILVLFIRQVLTSGLGEEPGWRGYLQPDLQTRYASDKSIWILGIIWAVWHYPITIYYTLAGISETPLSGIVITILMALLGQTISLVGISYIYAWVYNNTKSVFIAILFHALSNLIPAILLGEAGQMLGIFTAIMPWILVFALEKIYGKESFPGRLA
ncbi:MAG: CPBP family intramembrane metalloprotease [Anaerolineales bacterium]|nr:CPBP family intramembrane metalloprotease [Anaerolineales bacterium]